MAGRRRYFRPRKAARRTNPQELYSESMSSPAPPTPVFNPNPVTAPKLNPKTIVGEGEGTKHVPGVIILSSSRVEERSKRRGGEDACPQPEEHADEMRVHDFLVEAPKSNAELLVKIENLENAVKEIKEALSLITQILTQNSQQSAGLHLLNLNTISTPKQSGLTDQLRTKMILRKLDSPQPQPLNQQTPTPLDEKHIEQQITKRLFSPKKKTSPQKLLHTFGTTTGYYITSKKKSIPRKTAKIQAPYVPDWIGTIFNPH
ncbi:hypothetical protein VNO77_33739 [Canavalia gladiata]